MPISDIVNVSIVTTAAQLQQPGFGVPLILSAHALNTDRVRYYTGLAGMVSDGFTSTTPEYRAAAKIFAQNPRVQKLAVGRRALKPTQHFTVIPSAFDSTVYTLGIGDLVASFTSGVGATVAQIIIGLKAAVDALGLAVTTANVGPNTSLGITANTAGQWFQISSANPTLLNIAEDQADPGIATDLAAILVADQGWYAVNSTFASKAEILAAATWIEANAKWLVQQSHDTAIELATASNVALTAQTSAYARTAIMHERDSGQFTAAGWLGARLPATPGSETWKFASLAGVASNIYTATQLSNIKAASANYYTPIGGVNITGEGVEADGEFMDFVRGRDWFVARLQTRVFTLLTSPSLSPNGQVLQKLPYTDQGLQAIGAEVRGQITESINVGFLASSPAPSVFVPLAVNESNTDRQNRNANLITFSARAAGAVHATQINGVVTP